MKVTLGNIRQLIREQWYLEEYKNELVNDEAFGKESVYVPDGTKDKIRKWLKDMGLARKNVTR
jgi:hypothetical protein